MEGTNPFTKQVVPGATFLEWLFRRPRRRAAVAEINNILAEATQITDVAEDLLDHVTATHRVRIDTRLNDELCVLYRHYLGYCLRDKHLSDKEVAELSHLRGALRLSERQATEIHDDVAQQVFALSVGEAVKDARLDPNEKRFLQDLQTNLGLSDQVAQRIYTEGAQQRVQQQLDRATEDTRLSPEEDAELKAIAANLNVSMDMDATTRSQLDRLRLYWLIENAEAPPTIDVQLNLQRKERCYLKVRVDWHEHRRVTRSIRYSGPTARIRLAKGLYWRAGSVSVQRVAEDVLKHIDSGELYLTNKRIIFTGERKNTTIRLPRILSFEPYRNGVDIQKDSGKSPFLEFEHDVDLFCLYLDRALRDS